jgi:hypothetical protein
MGATSTNLRLGLRLVDETGERDTPELATHTDCLMLATTTRPAITEPELRKRCVMVRGNPFGWRRAT